MTDGGGLWVPGHVARRRRAPRELADLDFEVAGPDSRFQDHRAGCDCGDLDCPWYRGEVAAAAWRRLSAEERGRMTRGVVEAVRSDPAPFLD